MDLTNYSVWRIRDTANLYSNLGLFNQGRTRYAESCKLYEMLLYARIIV